MTTTTLEPPPAPAPLTFGHAWSRVRRFPRPTRWRCRRCGRLFQIRTWRPCAQQLLLPL